jgi:hypothetical protein
VGLSLEIIFAGLPITIELEVGQNSQKHSSKHDIKANFNISS